MFRFEHRECHTECPFLQDPPSYLERREDSFVSSKAASAVEVGLWSEILVGVGRRCDSFSSDCDRTNNQSRGCNEERKPYHPDKNSINIHLFHSSSMVIQNEFMMLQNGRFALVEISDNNVLRPAQFRIEGVGSVVSEMNVDRIKNATFWCVTLEEYIEIEEKVPNLRPIPPRILNVLQKQVGSVPLETVREKISSELYDHLYPYQREGVAMMMHMGGSAILADEMGLGKTLQAIAMMLVYKEARPCVITCPASVRQNWESNVRRFVTDDVGITWEGKNPCKNSVHIISYELLSTVMPYAKMRIYDESHKIKNPKALVTRAAVALSVKTPYNILISGTPLSRPKELYTQLKCVTPLYTKMFNWKNRGKFYRPGEGFFFSDRYCKPEFKPFGGRSTNGRWTHDGSQRLAELHHVMQRFSVRRTKDLVLSLPEKIREKVMIYKAPGELDLSQLDEVHEKRGDLMANATFMEMVRETCREKIPHVTSYIRDTLKSELSEDSGLKIILFGHHREMLDNIQEAIGKIGHIRIDGSVSGPKRQPLVDKFQTDPAIRVAILSISACATGLTLTAARLAVFTELRFGPDEVLQCEARCHRIGQVNPVTIRFLMSEGKSTDDVLWRMINKKADVSSQVIDNKRKRMVFERHVKTKKRKVTDSST